MHRCHNAAEEHIDAGVATEPARSVQPSAPLAPAPDSRATHTSRAWAIWGIVGGFLSLMFLTIPGWFALRSYRRWRRGEQPRPTFASVWGWVSVILIPLVAIQAWSLWKDRSVGACLVRRNF
jgi:hypothetical protein